MSALRWAWRRRRDWPLAALVLACLLCIQFAATPLGVVIVIVTPLLTAWLVMLAEKVVAVVNDGRHERALVRSIAAHPSRKGTQ